MGMLGLAEVGVCGLAGVGGCGDRLNVVTLSQRIVNDMTGWSEEVELEI